ncbi:hypothetical protein C1645_769727 [Glomus cerebriforme]|uniref:Uncharacterized protein n=1 Tax=Glomus cerebriforme TaxID=658196 RepID=A0A397SX17_9GLOM|nr:hypothetical protein C1645_769727 [Glomus cerebriforme]
MSSNNNNDDNDGMGRAYSTNEEFSKHLSKNSVRSTTNPVEYLEFLATQEQYAPKNLSFHQDSLPLPSQSQQQQLPTKEQFIQIKQVPSHYITFSNDNPQQNLTNTLNNNYNTINNNNYNPYFPPTEQQLQQIYQNKPTTSNQVPLSPLDEVVHNNPQYQIDDTNQQKSLQNQQPQQFQRHSIKYNNNNNSNDSDSDDDDDDSQIDHSAATPSPLSLSSLYLTRNRSRVSTPKIENLPTIPNAYTAQVQQSDSPLRTEFRNSDLNGSNSDSMRKHNIKNILGDILNKDRLTNFKERVVVKNPNESLVKFDFRNANGDPDDPLLNNNIQNQEEEQRPLPTGLLTGNINNNSSSSNNNNNNDDDGLNLNPRQHTSIVSPISTTSVTPIIPKPNNEVIGNLDIIKISPDVEIKIYKPKQGTILMLLAVFVLAAMVAISKYTQEEKWGNIIIILLTDFLLYNIAWKLGDWGVGDARDIYKLSTYNGFLTVSNTK